MDLKIMLRLPTMCSSWKILFVAFFVCTEFWFLWNRASTRREWRMFGCGFVIKLISRLLRHYTAFTLFLKSTDL